MVATIEHPKLGTLSYEADTKSKEWTTDPMKSAAGAVNNKKMRFLNNLLLRVLHSISSRILIVTRNYFLYVRINLTLTSVENYMIICTCSCN
jgi:hypothetical protein